ncbi:hypothetical protein [Tunicatimonas pelagia]|uniref:hypothetical protein n=1 Tax=Tunicatimonas pelagia TaxID=931531 RepID=UPI002666978D|nr:hypothetical protein [Tunicatimonas pelagia]WKN42888.1 hypothetical protein P0M28_28015 [Tunicatimonas pelagia]
MVLGLGSASISQAQSGKSTLPTVKHRKKKKEVKVPKARRTSKRMKDKSRPNRTTKRKERARDTYQRPQTKSGSKPVFDRYQRPKTKNASGRVTDSYRRPKTKSSSGVVRDRYQRPKTASGFKKVRDNYQRPPSLSPSGVVKDRYRVPESISGSKKVKDQYERPVTISPSGKVKVTEGRDSPPLEEGQKAPWLPLGNRIFTNQRLLKKKEKALEKASAQTSSYQGKQKRGVFYRKKQQRSSSEVSSYTGKQRRLPKYIQERVEKNYSKYVHQHRGYWRGPTAQAKSRYFKKLARKVHQYNGDIKRPRRGKDMHPSVDYLTARQKNSYQKKEKYRKRRIWLSQIFKSKDQPKHLKENTRKPRYDKKEAEIWNY